MGEQTLKDEGSRGREKTFSSRKLSPRTGMMYLCLTEQTKREEHSRELLGFLWLFFFFILQCTKLCLRQGLYSVFLLSEGLKGIV